MDDCLTFTTMSDIIIELPETNYVTLPDGTVARKLKPRKSKGKQYWFLQVGQPAKVVRFEQDEVESADRFNAKASAYTAPKE